MKVSISWLQELVKFDLNPQKLADLLSLKSIGVKQITDDFLELDLTYNRGDLLSLRGVARELAAITNSEVTFGDSNHAKYDIPSTPVKIEDEKLCPVYCVAKIENLKVEQSDETWVKKLSDSGIRSVNNIADVTNLIMLEFGQPMHAFDAKGVKDETIIVKTAKKGERITTLDGKTRDLKTSDLLIADSLNALGIAGVMGGKDSEVNDSTTTILLEAAIFDPVSIRNTSQSQGLSSEASKRFQHGLTKTNLLQALAAAIKMYEDLGGKLTAINMVGDLKDEVKTVNLNHQRLNDLIGVEIPREEVESSLKKLGFKLASHSSSGNTDWEVEVPYWRLDINIEEDLVEEVARMYGYEKIEGRPLEGRVPEKLDQSLQNSIQDLKFKLKEAGLTEVQTYSFYSSDVLNNFNLNKNDLIRVANPISSETEYLRDWLIPNLVEVVGRNLRKGSHDVAIFEIGKVYLKKKSSLPDEKYSLAIALMNGSDNPIQELYKIWQKLKLQLGKRAEEKVGLPNQEEYHNLFHPTRFISLSANGKDIGGIAELHLRIANMFGIEKRVAVLEIDLEGNSNPN
ncbi:phenylalanine--tRNA ligase subunit beta [Candidatus Daviesbacteria bacterium]|nr:phenylalanine--tRNA ligase subunit beta [Candidatus Daviesbacteria bacterium]